MSAIKEIPCRSCKVKECEGPCQCYFEWEEAKSLAAKEAEEAVKPEAPASLVEELESLAGEDNAYYMSINGERHGGPYCSQKSLQEIISRYRPVPDRMDELVRELDNWASVELSGTEQKEMGEIIAKFKGGK